MNKQASAPLPLQDQDWAYAVLADLKRVVREYATAATESVCPSVRKMFTDLLSSTLQMQGELFQVMKENHMYNTASPALRQEIQKQMNNYLRSQEKTQQFLHQRLSGQQGTARQPAAPQAAQTQSQAQPQPQQQYIMQPFVFPQPPTFIPRPQPVMPQPQMPPQAAPQPGPQMPPQAAPQPQPQMPPQAAPQPQPQMPQLAAQVPMQPVRQTPSNGAQGPEFLQ